MNGNIDLRKRKYVKEVIILLDKQKLRASVVLAGLTMEDVAKSLNINVATLYRKMNGESDFTRGEVQTLRTVLKIDAETAEAIFFAA
jgi:predicted transcriptional regulator